MKYIEKLSKSHFTGMTIFPLSFLFPLLFLFMIAIRLTGKI